MESEKVKEIKKSLECCSNPICEGKCHYHSIGCMSDLSKDSLTLINEWEKEIEDRKAEVLHLQEYGKKLIRETELKQFAERLKEKIKNFCGTENENAYYEVTKSFACKEIDETLKEFLK